MMSVTRRLPFHSVHIVPHDSPFAKTKKIGTRKVITYQSYLDSLPGYEEPSTEYVVEGEAFINRLPVELLTEIFEMTVERFPMTAGAMPWKSHSEYIALRWHRNQAPFNLLQICSSWRAIVQSTTSLWTSISALQFRYCRPAVPEMQYWLDYSGSSPLRLHLDCVEDDCVDEDPFLPHALLGLFADQAHRWESLALSLTLPLVKEFTAILQNKHHQHRFPLLEQLELQLDIRDSYDQHAIEQLADAISSVKSLRRIYWSVDAEFGGYLNLPWKQLDAIHIIMPLSTDCAISWMSRCDVASRITFHGLWTQETKKHVSNSEAILYHLPFLKHLDLEGFPVTDILARLVLPNLETLHIETRSRDVMAYCTLEALLVRSQCVLKEVVIFEKCCSTMISELALHCLSITPLHAVPKVEITHNTIDACIYHRLQVQPSVKHVKLPRILAWKSVQPSTYPGIGWKDLEPEEEERFSWDKGKLETFCDPLLLVTKN